ncbi:uncharacterized protein LOC110931004 isoform X1 [Helianthus annuus]|uniref:uncharacterized protein LOC110931004 isoform X1 n=1 Tax=Helianthus annuus TaxID=4232 RepID=UPI000B8F9053|nr:uncharacterized protein LOC110931004 isoform X1 [Helianthus annuus]
MARSSYEMFLAPSSPRLPLSTDFVRELLEKKILEGPIILHTKGGHSWRLEIKQINDTYYFTNGWNNVVEDMQLRFGDYLYFRPLDQSTIKMSIFRPKECNRFLAPKVKHKDDDDPFFTSIITKTHTKMLRFPGGFAELAGINAQGTMTLKNLDGKEWLVGLRLDKAFRTKRYLLSFGWGRFRQQNNLSEGDECVFRFIKSEGKLLLAKVTKMKPCYGVTPRPD